MTDLHARIARATALACASLLLVTVVSECGGGSAAELGSSSGLAELVMVEPIDGVGRVLVGADGLALYTPDHEASGTIACTGSCTQLWIPLTTGSGFASRDGPGRAGSLGVIRRPDGERQVTFRGQPLYRFSEDSRPHAVSGDELTDSFGGHDLRWHVVTVDDPALR